MIALVVAVMTMFTAAPAGAATEEVTGTATTSGGNGLTTVDFVYSSPGLLGSGTIHSDFVLFDDPPGSRTEGTGVLVRSDGATLTGTGTSTVRVSPTGGFDVVSYFTVTSGTGGLAGVTGEVAMTGNVVWPGSTGDVFTMSGTLTTPSPVAVDKDGCKADGWQDLVDDQGEPFRNQGQCVSFVVSPASALLQFVDGDANASATGTADVEACAGAGYPACDPPRAADASPDGGTDGRA